MRKGEERILAHPGLYLGVMFLVISAQVFWWLLFFSEIRFALVYVQDERDRILEMALNDEPGLKPPPYFIEMDGMLRADPAVIESRRRERDRNVVMLVAEASFFLGVFGAGSLVLIRLYRKQRQYVKERDLFLNSFTHELKTPLAAIKLNLQTLKKRPDHAAAPELLDGSLREVDILNGRISEILLGGELTSEQRRTEKDGNGGTELVAVLDRSLTSLQSLIKEREASISIGWLSPLRGWRCYIRSGSFTDIVIEKDAVDGKGTVLRETLQTMQSLEEKKLSMDAKELGIIVTELITNALIYSQPPVRLRILMRARRKRMQIFFVDEGPGIPFSERNNIFQPMVRLQGKGGFIPGTGMGLANARALLRRWNGSIRLLPTSKGARFLVEVALKGAS